MPYDSNISRSDADALMPEDAVREIFATPPQSSVIGQLARKLRDMQRGELRMPVMSALPQAYFVGEKGRSPQTFGPIKQTSEAAWENKYIHAEEIAVILPVPESVVEDMDYPIWEETLPYVREAIYGKLDYSVLFGTQNVDVPANWPNGILVAMPAAHRVPVGSVGEDLYDDLMGVGGVLSQVEEDGYFVSGHVAALGMRARLRGLRTEDGLPIFVQDMKAKTPYALDGSPLVFPRNGGFDPAEALQISGDFEQLVWSIRQDIRVKVLTEGVITDNSTPRQIIHNLAQDDMIALRVTFRAGWQLPNPPNRVNPDNNTRYPFAALVPAEESA